MSSVVNNRLLRKFIFAIWEDTYKEQLDRGYGQVISLSKTVNIGHSLGIIELFNSIQGN